MDNWLCAYGPSMIWTLVMLCSAFFLPHDHGSDDWSWVRLDVGFGLQDEDFAFYVAMATAAHV